MPRFMVKLKFELFRVKAGRETKHVAPAGMGLLKVELYCRKFYPYRTF